MLGITYFELASELAIKVGTLATLTVVGAGHPRRENSSCILERKACVSFTDDKDFVTESFTKD